METRYRPGENTGVPRPARVDRRTFSSTVMQNLSLRDRFEQDRPHTSHGDNNRVGGKSQIPSGNNLKKQTRRVNTDDSEELVKHMSNLPSYLERAVKPQEKAFSVGVLDWGLLEKWESSKQVTNRTDGSSSSTSNSSSLFSTEESSSYLQTGQNSTDYHHRHRRVPSEACTLDGKPRNLAKYKPGSTVESRLKEVGSSSTTSSSKTAYRGNHDNSFTSGQCSADLEKQERRSRRSQSMSFNHKSTKKDEKPILIRPLDDCSTVSATKNLKETTSQRNPKEKEQNCTERYSNTNTPYGDLSCNVPHSCPLTCDVNNQNIRVLRPSKSQAAETNDNATSSGSQLHSTGKLKVTSLPPVADPPKRPEVSKRPVSTTNIRYSSPTARFSLRMGSRKSSSTENVELLQTGRVHTVDKPLGAVHSTSIDKQNCDKPAAGSKSRSSPLKRMLEPLLKQREPSNNQSSASLKKDSKPINSGFKTLDRPSTAPGVRVGLNFSEKCNDPAVVQALLQVVVQNGYPLFTFAVDSVKDIICAALSKLGTDKTSGERYLYTFFSVQEIKNRSWMNLRGKGSGHEYSPNVIAQMDVSETGLSSSNIFRQFVLSTVNMKPGEKSEYQINDELAAVVVCVPRETGEKSQQDKYNGTTVILPSGVHTLPSKGLPSSLIDRWRSGGQCDCGGWDPGCKLRIMNASHCQPTSSVKVKLYEQGSVEEKQPSIFSLAPFKDKEGVLSVSFSSSISPLQAFSICLAMLDSRNLLRPAPAKVQEAKISNHTTGDEVTGSYFSVPPHSPVGRV